MTADTAWVTTILPVLTGIPDNSKCHLYTPVLHQHPTEQALQKPAQTPMRTQVILPRL